MSSNRIWRCRRRRKPHARSPGSIPPGSTSVLLRDLTAKQHKNLGPGFAVALSSDHRTVAMVSPDHSAVRLVPTGPGATEQVPVPGLLVQEEVGAWSRDGKTLWFTARPTGEVG